MPRFDLTAEELHSYRPTVAEPADFDEFWAATLAESRARALPPQIRRQSSALRAVEVYDVTTSGFQGELISFASCSPGSR
ncbi:acetylxylan esterase [Microbacterium sp. 179-I 3D3 NHS]|uniref:acetylxylan esterase n=1 Tax=Microbacterium sp. 179-I 3D3 NHS TaxID=3142382 RepID=UPI0039A1F6A2